MLLLYWETDFSTSMLQELVGFALQSLFIVFIFALFEWRSSRQKKINHKLTLRAFLSEMLDQALFRAQGNVGVDPSEPMPVDVEVAELSSLDQEALETMRIQVAKRIDAMRILTPLVAEIDAAHLICWNQMLEANHKLLDENQGPEEAMQYVDELVLGLRHFDELSVD
uniref:Uncharacterized protein n=1 Tax=Magnetococcus massalia (strain MO-1) TaxID=451514 RepID=A0A1S7LL05_MAGMO|nr:conserved protein of unknown function [Candidatus Magnetococcus massalia]